MTTKIKEDEPVTFNPGELRHVLTQRGGKGVADPDYAVIRAACNNVNTYRPPNAETLPKFDHVKQAIVTAMSEIVLHCPPSGDRTAAIRLLMDARMAANRAISLEGEF